jgi:hypothetical protein
MGACVEGELHLVMDANVSKPIDFHLFLSFLYDRPTHDETSYPPTNALSVLFICGSPFLGEKHFSAFSGIPR